MEIGHNVMHGQWDWMRDPTIHSTSWEWDNVSPSDGWKHSHNELHHTYTNVRGKDNDLGYGIMRVDENQPWKPMYLVQPLSNAINACIFQAGSPSTTSRSASSSRAASTRTTSSIAAARCSARSVATRPAITCCIRCCPDRLRSPP